MLKFFVRVRMAGMIPFNDWALVAQYWPLRQTGRVWPIPVLLLVSLVPILALSAYAIAGSRPRFSLRTLLIVTTLVGILLGLFAWLGDGAGRAQRNAREAAIRHGRISTE
jgi:hypothetical protein